MIRYELYSNAASSDQGLVNTPWLMDLVDRLAARGVETFIHLQRYQQTGEINLANEKYGKGVTAKTTTLKHLRPESFLKGSLEWLRAVGPRPERGMHLDFNGIRATNGGVLLLEPLLKHNQWAFISGVENGLWERLISPVDLTLAQAPKTIRRSTALKQDFMERGARAASMLPLLRDMAEVDFLPEEARKKFTRMADAASLEAEGGLTEGEVVNLLLLAETRDRYALLFAQFLEALLEDENSAETAPLLDLLTQGVSLVELKLRLGDFLLPGRAALVADKKTLAHELRIGLLQMEPERDRFLRQLELLVLRKRLDRDPYLYARTVPLAHPTLEYLEVASPLRKFLVKLERTPRPPANRVLQDETRFDLMKQTVELTYLGDYGNRRPMDQLPPRAMAARSLLGGFLLKHFDITKLHSLNPKVPSTGVAKNFAQKIPLTAEDLEQVVTRLGEMLFGKDGWEKTLAEQLTQAQSARSQQEKTGQMRRFLTGAHHLLPLTNYRLARGTTPADHAVAAAGQLLGLSVGSDGPAHPLEENKLGRGVVDLSRHEIGTLLGAKTPSAVLAPAYQALMTRRIVQLTRRFIAHRLESLFKTHQNQLFDRIHHHLVWEKGLNVSRNQLALLLFRQGVFDKVRLKAYGFDPGSLHPGETEPQAQERGRRHEDPFLLPQRQEEGAEDPRFHSARLEEAHRRALEAFTQRLADTRARALQEGKQGQEGVNAVLVLLAESGTPNPAETRAAHRLAATPQADALWALIEKQLAPLAQSMPGSPPQGDSPGEAEFFLPRPLAPLAWLCSSRTLRLGEASWTVELSPHWAERPEELPPASARLATGLAAALSRPEGGPTAQALAALTGWREDWAALVRTTSLSLLGALLAETVLKLSRPGPPTLEDTARLPAEQVLLLAATSSDHGRFKEVHPSHKNRESLATLSEVASWLARFPRLEEEFDLYRTQVEEVLEQYRRFGLSLWEAPHMAAWASRLETLAQALAVAPEFLDEAGLTAIQQAARQAAVMARENHQKEQGLRMRDRWMTRLSLRIKAVRPEGRLNFMEDLFAEEADHQTFTLRSKEVLAIRHRLEKKTVFVLAPLANQRAMTLGLVEQLYRLKGLFTVIWVDISNADSLADELRGWIPPHRLIELTGG
ncbi:MAG: hypothetical protein OEV94_08745 [Deltaproteobacteria bacterium]|nr:hypothetical protein [Deltaproteobacteria bacterium]